MEREDGEDDDGDGICDDDAEGGDEMAGAVSIECEDGEDEECDFICDEDEDG